MSLCTHHSCKDDLKIRFIDVDSGRSLGAHKGMEFYTIGQKARIEGQRLKYYVVGRREKDSSVLVASGSDHPRLYSDYLLADSRTFAWIRGERSSF